MHRMTGFDALFLYDEAPNEPQHTLKVAILGPGAVARYSFDRAKKEVRARLAGTPPFCWRALRVPFDLHHPVWIEDPAIDVDHHVRRLGIPSPGGRRELCEVISEIAGSPLDPTKPLWEIWFLEGYEGGRIVAVLKMNHALADGESTRELLERLLGEKPTSRDETVACAFPSSTRASAPSRGRLLREAVRDLR